MTDQPGRVPRSNLDHARHLLDYAQAYRRSLSHLIATKDEEIDPVLCFLASHSIELLLKSYAAFLGKDEERIENQGHKIASTLDKCERINPLDVPGLREICEQIDDANWLGFDFRYPGEARPLFGEPDSVMQVIEHTEQVIQDRAGTELLLSGFQRASDNRPGQPKWVYASTTSKFAGRKSRLPNEPPD